MDKTEYNGTFIETKAKQGGRVALCSLRMQWQRIGLSTIGANTPHFQIPKFPNFQIKPHENPNHRTPNPFQYTNGSGHTGKKKNNDQESS